MLVFALHQFRETSETSECAHRVARMCEDFNEVKCFVPTYPANNPHLAHIYLTDFVTQMSAEYDDYNLVFVGFQLGGFWARHLARVFPPGKVALINPTTMPYIELHHFEGMNQMKGSGTRFEMYPNDINAYKVYSVEQDRTDLSGIVMANRLAEFVDHPRLETYEMEGTEIPEESFQLIYDTFFKRFEKEIPEDA